MKLNKKLYETVRIKNYIQSNTLGGFFQGANKNSKKWLYIEQEMKLLGYNFYKILNKIIQKTLDKSIYSQNKLLFHGLNFYIKPLKKPYTFIKNIFDKKFEPLLFICIAIKINNKIYSKTDLEKLYSLKYKKNKLIYYQFNMTQLKRYIGSK